MGNNRLATMCHLPGNTPNLSPAPGASGILVRIQAQYVAAALNLLPPAASSTTKHREVEVDAGPDGRVRFFAEKKEARHHRHSHHFWSVYRAEPVVSDDAL
jgi:hypothetical protein